MRTHSAVGLTRTKLTTLIGSLDEEDLLAITQDRSVIIQVKNPNVTFLYLYSSLPFSLLVNLTIVNTDKQLSGPSNLN